ncbi:MAG: MmcQ/YjbR family DNA-binding protein [Anaerolineae bacterium]|nr:MmcQ/YjbR family DNA-binding protein [Phycisphaerae bacterium]
MTATEFRNIALVLPEALESSHMDHPDFRVRKKIFATLGHPDKTCGMVKLTPEQQDEFVANDPEVFQPVSGGWGRQGATTVHLKPANENIVRRAMIAAWRNTAPKSLTKDFDGE